MEREISGCECGRPDETALERMLIRYAKAKIAEERKANKQKRGLTQNPQISRVGNRQKTR